MKIIPLSEGSFTVDATKKFIPFRLSEDEMSARPQGSLLVEIQPFLILTSKDILLLDTGLGFNHRSGDQMQLLAHLAEHGIQSGDVTKVLMSHLHKDHTGGMVHPATGKPTFENATYCIQEREVAFAREKDGASYDFSKVQPVLAGKVELLKADEGSIDGYIQYQVTGAHSKFHQVFWIREDGETLFFGADDAPQYQQMKHRFAAKYDYDGKKAMELRSGWWEKGKKEDWQFLFYHDTRKPVARPGSEPGL
ncbi:MBL fold metallo-hydrolase [Niabella drilacis]|uniref:Glyoxylase, beta-lactamase superfamily II n=1 Tax=Niabella drilacis (strain DSM 25811 / CCM 8410 / CCUG 62505 / LMG 26954 / E90) TaxID=1285928 RepID=A0A1G6NTN6_NIADE|nr:MBL fold metallo-hydrolase [Niabella drilacis]SDC71370.1 Glyoxylase, beta-lactamase superfamily II [Niabella drilacis]